MMDVHDAAWKTAALIGAGRMGRSHATALREMGVGLTAVCDLKKEPRDALGEDFGVPPENRFASALDMFTKYGPFDIVVISTTAETHKAMTCMAARAGARNILCEKPMATSVADCDAMIASCAATGARLAINHQMRFMDQYFLVKDILDGGCLGRLASMTVVGGCFGLAMNGSHYVEAFRYLTGTNPVSATAWLSREALPNPRGDQFFDQAGEVRIEGNGGQRLSLIIGADQGHGMTVMYACADGHIFVDELQGEAIVTARKPEHRSMPPTRYGMPWTRETITFPQSDNVRPTKGVLAALVAGVDYPTPEQARQVVATLVACYLSSERGHLPVRLSELGEAEQRVFPWA